jgi:hypothetical protein
VKFGCDSEQSANYSKRYDNRNELSLQKVIRLHLTSCGSLGNVSGPLAVMEGLALTLLLADQERDAVAAR